MKKAKKLLICLTAAALVCSACAVSACGSKDSDIVTDEEWEAAFAIENFYNVTIEYEHTYTESYSDSEYSSNYSQKATSTKKIALVDGGEYDYGNGSVIDIVIGNIYSVYSTESKESKDYTDASLEDINKTSTSEDLSYSLYGSDFYNTASKSSTDSDEGIWSSHSSDYPTFVELYTLIETCREFSNIDYVNTLSREYKDGAYVVTMTYSLYDMFYMEDGYFESVGYEFTGGDQINYIKFNDGKLTSVKLTQEYSLVLGDGTERGLSVAREFTFTDYGKTSVTIPDEVTALFN